MDNNINEFTLEVTKAHADMAFQKLNQSQIYISLCRDCVIAQALKEKFVLRDDDTRLSVMSNYVHLPVDEVSSQIFHVEGTKMEGITSYRRNSLKLKTVQNNIKEMLPMTLTFRRGVLMLDNWTE